MNKSHVYLKKAFISLIIIMQPISGYSLLQLHIDSSIQFLNSAEAVHTQAMYANAEAAAKDGYLKPLYNLGFSNKNEFDKAYLHLKAESKKQDAERTKFFASSLVLWKIILFLMPFMSMITLFLFDYQENREKWNKFFKQINYWIESKKLSIRSRSK